MFNVNDLIWVPEQFNAPSAIGLVIRDASSGLLLSPSAIAEKLRNAAATTMINLPHVHRNAEFLKTSLRVGCKFLLKFDAMFGIGTTKLYSSSFDTV